MTDKLDKLTRIAELLTKRFGESSSFMIMTRMSEEVGELAKEVNRSEQSGVKAQKMGAPSKEALAREAQDVIRTVMQLVAHYGIEQEFQTILEEDFVKFQEKYKDL